MPKKKKTHKILAKITVKKYIVTIYDRLEWKNVNLATKSPFPFELFYYLLFWSKIMSGNLPFRKTVVHSPHTHGSFPTYTKPIAYWHGTIEVICSEIISEAKQTYSFIYLLDNPFALSPKPCWEGWLHVNDMVIIIKEILLCQSAILLY